MWRRPLTYRALGGLSRLIIRHASDGSKSAGIPGAGVASTDRGRGRGDHPRPSGQMGNVAPSGQGNLPSPQLFPFRAKFNEMDARRRDSTLPPIGFGSADKRPTAPKDKVDAELMEIMGFSQAQDEDEDLDFDMYGDPGTSKPSRAAARKAKTVENEIEAIRRSGFATITDKVYSEDEDDDVDYLSGAHSEADEEYDEERDTDKVDKSTASTRFNQRKLKERRLSQQQQLPNFEPDEDEALSALEGEQYGTLSEEGGLYEDADESEDESEDEGVEETEEESDDEDGVKLSDAEFKQEIATMRQRFLDGELDNMEELQEVVLQAGFRDIAEFKAFMEEGQGEEAAEDKDEGQDDFETFEAYMEEMKQNRREKKAKTKAQSQFFVHPSRTALLEYEAFEGEGLPEESFEDPGDSLAYQLLQVGSGANKAHLEAIAEEDPEPEEENPHFKRLQREVQQEELESVQDDILEIYEPAGDLYAHQSVRRKEALAKRQAARKAKRLEKAKAKEGEVTASASGAPLPDMQVLQSNQDPRLRVRVPRSTDPLTQEIMQEAFKNLAINPGLTSADRRRFSRSIFNELESLDRTEEEEEDWHDLELLKEMLRDPLQRRQLIGEEGEKEFDIRRIDDYVHLTEEDKKRAIPEEESFAEFDVDDASLDAR